MTSLAYVIMHSRRQQVRKKTALIFVIRAFSDFKAFLYILIGGFSLKPPIKIYIKALKSEKARIMIFASLTSIIPSNLELAHDK